ncbi:cyclic lactone autoinducer peptide [Enterococcus thailandicus]|uniref:AgrD family cyclic lactone autoinducer peptide n=1 Tax=Enterococcus thailandicus TaxID=417368 RepID=UPI0022EC1171|nr:cyclic lactone autoinducer peptide [Enterococcus thailandicus]MDA3972653.1 cyclic lactone autoinducer peptide [Enterococcus thailandicus]MDA3975149.1 cyclic lactone autoinducer peptide [Enterococcus thailandicus]MDA3980113.1 cyclic lactone autoinducer peptide [Enterococcus thailandicus]
MMKKFSNVKIQMLSMVSAVALVAYEVATTSGICLLMTYEPKMPEALKNEMEK